MAHYAKVDENNIVQEVITFSDDVEPGVPEAPLPEGWRWIQTSFNKKIRKNYAGVGFTYDEERDAFIPQKAHASWTLDEETCDWVSPVARPKDKRDYIWNDLTQSWDLVE